MDLEYTSTKEVEGYTTIRVFARAYQLSYDYFKKKYIDTGKHNWGDFVEKDELNEYAQLGYRNSENGELIAGLSELSVVTSIPYGITTKGFDYLGTSLNYSSAGIQFQKAPSGHSSKTTIYTQTASYGSEDKNSTIMSYALNKKPIDVSPSINNINLYDYITNQNGNYTISNNLGNIETMRSNAINSDNVKTFRCYRWTINENYVSISDWLIPNELIESAKNSGYVDDGKIRFSLYTSVLENCYKQQCEMGLRWEDGAYESGGICNKTPILEDDDQTLRYSAQLTDNVKLTIKEIKNSIIDSLPEWIKVLGGNLKDMFNRRSENEPDNADPSNNKSANVRKIAYSTYDAYQITTVSDKVNFYSGSWGIKGYYDGASYNAEYSIANDYDNWLLTDDITKNSKKNVYIRHVLINNDGSEAGLLDNLTNPSEAFYNGSSWSMKNKGNTGNQQVGSYIYQEVFTGLNENSRIKASRSGNLIQDGKRYVYWGYKAGSGETVQAAQINHNNAIAYSNETVESGDQQCTVITFYYRESNVSTPEPKLYFGEGSSSATSEGCYLFNVSGGSTITPYIIAKKFYLKNLKYSISVNANGAISYSVTDFVVSKINSMAIQNSDGIQYKGQNVVGKVLGSSQEYLFNTSDGNLLNNTGNSTLASINAELSGTYSNFSSKSSLRTVENNYDNITGSNTKQSDFTKKYTVMNTAYNGLRYVKGVVIYQDYRVTSGNISAIGNVSTVEAGNKQFVNVANEFTLKEPTIETKDFVNHTNNKSASSIIQKNAEFTVTFTTNTTAQKHLSKFYIWFDFPVKYNGVQYNKNQMITISRSSDMTKNTTFTAIATDNNDEEGDYVAQIENHMFVVAASDNVPSSWVDKIIKGKIPENKLYSAVFNGTSNLTSYYIGSGSNTVSRRDICTTSQNITKYNNGISTNSVDLYEDIYYFAWKKLVFKTISRIYDFKVTDCLDVNYKSVFRKSSSGTVNDLTGIQYYSGTKELKIYGSSYNVLETRSKKEKETILPLGPYKNTDTKYIFAPKLGYRISYDLKTSGYFNYEKGQSTRYVEIIPSYYYISKDGKVYKGGDAVSLYYKNSSGKYVKFNSTNMYAIYFTPNDGYRYINNLETTANIDSMSRKLTELKISNVSGFTLNSSMMATSDNNFIQSWYGEFKLPNSTIIVQGDDINSPLTDGYIGVKFEIRCIDVDGNDKTITSYNTVDSVRAKSAKYPENTTQWDYEGYLGFEKVGEQVDNIPIQLEKGTWNIDNDMYQKIKGTVILYDTDSRAADDFN